MSKSLISFCSTNFKLTTKLARKLLKLGQNQIIQQLLDHNAKHKVLLICIWGFSTQRYSESFISHSLKCAQFEMTFKIINKGFYTVFFYISLEIS